MFESAPLHDFERLPSQLAFLKKNVKVLKRIPKAARIVSAYSFAKVVNKATELNDADSLIELLLFAYKSFPVPTKSKQSLSKLVKNNVKNSELPQPNKTVGTKSTPLPIRVESKVAEGDIKGAVKLLSSSDTLAKENESTYTQLLMKHPTPSRDLHFPDVPSLTVDDKKFKEAIYSFPNGSAGGIDGLRPQHLKDMISFTGEAGVELIAALTKLSNLMLSGKVNENIVSIFYGANLCALDKKDGGIRPIAVGCILRRLVSKMACRSEFSNITGKLRPKQIGVATKGGCEAAVHAVRSYLSYNESSYKVLVKVDLANAFNSVERDDLLHSILKFTPNIFKFFYQCYRMPSILFFGDYRLSSQVGVQQGDPSGPMIFSLAIQPIIEELKSELNVWFLDDGTIAGNMDTVLNDLKIIKEKFAEIGLKVNTNKCEIYKFNNKNDETLTSFTEIMPSIRLVEDLTLLGAPIVISAGEVILMKKEKEIDLFFSRLKDLNQHVAYFILRNSLGIPRWTYLLRTTPLWKYPEIVNRIDSSMKSALEGICNSIINDYQYIIASLPCRLGGIGIRKLEDIIYPAFLSSVLSTSGLINEMLSTCAIDLPGIVHYNEGLTAWTSMGNIVPPESERIWQRRWDEMNIARVTSSLIFPSPSHEARYRAGLRKESNCWLSVIPSKHIGTLLDNNTFRISTALRLGSEMCHPFQCICGSWVNSYGTHGLCCHKSAGRYARHSELNNIIHRGLSSANIPSSLEPYGLFRDDGKRPDGVTFIPWSKGQCMVWDATCVDTLANSYLNSTKREAGQAAERAAKMKINKYKKLKEQNYMIIPFAVETVGPWSSEAIKFTNDIGKLIAKVTGESKAKLFFMQNISLAIQRGNAASIMRCYPESDSLNAVFYII